MARFADLGLEGPPAASSPALVGLPLAPSLSHAPPPASLGPLSRGGREPHDLPHTESPEDRLQALVIWTSREFKSGQPPHQMQTCVPACGLSQGLRGGRLRPPPTAPHWPLRSGTHSILRLPSSRPLPSTISTQSFTGSSSGLEKSIWTFTGCCTRAWSSTYEEKGCRSQDMGC